MKKIIVLLVGLTAFAAQGQWSYKAQVVSKQGTSLLYGGTNALVGRYAISSINIVMPDATLMPVAASNMIYFYDSAMTNNAGTIDVSTNYFAAWTSNYWGLTNVVTYMTNTTGWFTNATTGQGYSTVAPSATGSGPGLVTNIDTGYCMFPVAVAAAWTEPRPILTVNGLAAGSSTTYQLPYVTAKGLCIKTLSHCSNVIVTIKYRPL